MSVRSVGPLGRSAAVLVALLTNGSAHALVLVPTQVRNDAPVPVRIRVTRFVNCVGRDRSDEGPWVSEVILARGQEGTLPLMGGAAELCVSGVQKITIETATGQGVAPAAQDILPLSINDQFPDHWLFWHVRVDPHSHRFILRAAPPAASP